jgi:hypothetical protein
MRHSRNSLYVVHHVCSRKDLAMCSSVKYIHIKLDRMELLPYLNFQGQRILQMMTETR